MLHQQQQDQCLKFLKIIPHAYTPSKSSPRAAGFDIKSLNDIIVPAMGRAKISTGLKFELPTNCYGRIAPRSGLAINHFIDVGAGVIDEDYRGELYVLLFNHSTKDFHIKSGDRIAQLICEKIFHPRLEEVTSLTETERGEHGFGSTENKQI